MPKIELYTGSATGTTVPVKQSAIATNLYRTDYLLEGRIDTVNANTANMTVAPSVIYNMVTDTNPVEGDKFFGDGSATVTDDIFTPLMDALEDNIVPINLNASTTFILAENQDEPESKKGLVDQLIDTIKEDPISSVAVGVGGLISGISGAAAAYGAVKGIGNLFGRKKKRKNKEQLKREQAAEMTKLKALEKDGVRIKRIIIPKTPNIRPITTPDVFNFWGVDTDDFVDSWGHQKYIFNCDITIDGKYANDIDERDRPKIDYYEPIINAEYIEFVVILHAPQISTGDRLVVEIDFNILCEIRP